MTIRIAAGPIGRFEDDFSAFRNDIVREAHLTAVSRARFEGICLNPSSARDAACVHAALARHGLAFLPPTHSVTLTRRSADDASTELQRHVRAARSLGATELTVCEAGCTVMSEADWQRFGTRLSALAATFAESGVRLVYRPRKGTIVAVAEDIDKLVAVTDPRVGLMLDADVLGGDLVDIARRHAQRVAIVAPGAQSRDVMAVLPAFRGWTVLDESAGHAPDRVDDLREVAGHLLAA